MTNFRNHRCYRYKVSATTASAADAFIKPGATIFESRFRGRTATWNAVSPVGAYLGSVGGSLAEPAPNVATPCMQHPQNDGVACEQCLRFLHGSA